MTSVIAVTSALHQTPHHISYKLDTWLMSISRHMPKTQPTKDSIMPRIFACLSCKCKDPDANEDWIADQAFEDVALAVDLARIDLVE